MNTEEWPNISHAAGSVGLKAFHKVWYAREPLTETEDKLLRGVFEKYPMGVTNFNVWLKQRVRQLYENFIKRQNANEIA